MASQTCYLCEGYSGGCTGACNSHQLGRAELPPKGCICPPGSEKTCQRWDCGRKNPTVTSGTFVVTTALSKDTPDV